MEPSVKEGPRRSSLGHPYCDRLAMEETKHCCGRTQPEASGVYWILEKGEDGNRVIYAHGQFDPNKAALT